MGVLRLILDHEVGILKGVEELDVKWQIRDDKTGKRVLTDKLEIVIIELPKARRIYEQDENNEISQWMMFLDDPNDKEVDEIMAKNRDISKAIAELEQVSGEERLQRIAELREKAIRDEHATHEYFKNRGLREGKEEGERNKAIEIAKNMIKEKMSIEVIERITGLNKSDIEALK